MPRKNDIYHSVLIVTSSEPFYTLVKQSLTGDFTIEVRKSAATARRCILERYYDIVLINSPLPDETGMELAIYVTEQSNASVLLVPPQDIFEDILQQVTDHGIFVVPKPSPRGRIDKAVRYLVAVQNRMRALEKKIQTAEEKLEELRTVSKAKCLLIEQRKMTEDEAHRLIGKMAMDNGISRGRAAQRILDDMD